MIHMIKSLNYNTLYYLLFMDLQMSRAAELMCVSRSSDDRMCLSHSLPGTSTRRDESPQAVGRDRPRGYATKYQEATSSDESLGTADGKGESLQVAGRREFWGTTGSWSDCPQVESRGDSRGAVSRRCEFLQASGAVGKPKQSTGSNEFPEATYKRSKSKQLPGGNRSPQTGRRDRAWGVAGRDNSMQDASRDRSRGDAGRNKSPHAAVRRERYKEETGRGRYWGTVSRDKSPAGRDESLKVACKDRARGTAGRDKTKQTASRKVNHKQATTRHLSPQAAGRNRAWGPVRRNKIPIGREEWPREVKGRKWGYITSSSEEGD